MGISDDRPYGNLVDNYLRRFQIPSIVNIAALQACQEVARQTGRIPIDSVLPIISDDLYLPDIVQERFLGVPNADLLGGVRSVYLHRILERITRHATRGGPVHLPNWNAHPQPTEAVLPGYIFHQPILAFEWMAGAAQGRGRGRGRGRGQWGGKDYTGAR